MKEEEIVCLEKEAKARILGNTVFCERLNRIHKLCLMKLIPEPKSKRWKTICPKCGQKLKIMTEGPFSLAKCTKECGYEYIYQFPDDEKNWRVEYWSRFYDWGKELL